MSSLTLEHHHSLMSSLTLELHHSLMTEPRVTAPTNMRAALGESVSLVCDAQGFPAPAITWYRKDGEMP
ncbi:hypothetical protein MAR_005315, partial [Mya arenaria]